MSLLKIWKANPEEIGKKQIHQLVALAGGGDLTDGGDASAELREFVSEVPTALLASYLNQCLASSFSDSGLALQDIVNELGVRLGCAVEHGLYRGKQSAIGFDGIWRFSDGYAVVVEVKTTDTYTVPLDRLASYRSKLIKAGQITESSSILIVVGRNDTDSLEAQVRGSRHAWDIRLISADKLLALVQIKEAADNKETVRKIRKVLTPLELTRVDFIVDLLATAADDIQQGALSEEEDVMAGEGDKKWPEKKFTPVAFHQDVIDRVSRSLEKQLKKETRSLYSSTDDQTSVRAVVSKAHESGSRTYYWYAFHPYYLDPLKEYEQSFIAFGCGDASKTLLFDLKRFSEWLPFMNKTELDDRHYWHVHFMENEAGHFELQLKGGNAAVDADSFKLP